MPARSERRSRDVSRPAGASQGRSVLSDGCGRRQVHPQPRGGRPPLGADRGRRSAAELRPRSEPVAAGPRGAPGVRALRHPTCEGRDPRGVVRSGRRPSAHAPGEEAGPPPRRTVPGPGDPAHPVEPVPPVRPDRRAARGGAGACGRGDPRAARGRERRGAPRRARVARRRSDRRVRSRHRDPVDDRSARGRRRDDRGRPRDRQGLGLGPGSGGRTDRGRALPARAARLRTRRGR